MKKRRGKLPLDDPRWVPIEEAIERRYKQTRSYTLTAADLNEALQSERLHSLEHHRKHLALMLLKWEAARGAGTA